MYSKYHCHSFRIREITKDSGSDAAVKLLSKENTGILV